MKASHKPSEQKREAVTSTPAPLGALVSLLLLRLPYIILIIPSSPPHPTTSGPY